MLGQQQSAAQSWWRAQLGLLGLGGLFSSRSPMYGDQPFHGLVPPQLQSGLGHISWKDMINQAIKIAESESANARRMLEEWMIENKRLRAIVEKPDWCELFERKDL